MIGGPQTERDRLSGSELLNDVKRDDIVISHGHEIQVYEGELNRLRRDNKFLNDHTQRCLRELKAYRLKYPGTNVDLGQREGDTLPPWVTNAEINTPLFDAYDSRIYELEEELRLKSLHLTILAEKAESITSENDNLRNIQLETLRQNARGGRNDTGNGMNASDLETLQELNEQLEILMAENAHLVEEKDLLMDELNTTQMELERCREEMEHMSKLLFTAEREHKVITARATEAESTRDVSENKLHQASIDIGRLEQEMDVLKEQLILSESRCSNADKNMADARLRLQQMERKMVEDSYRMAQKTKGVEDRVRELHLVVLQRTQELENVNELYRKLKREHQSTRQDAEGMLHVLSGMEKQLQEYAAKEEELQRFSRESKEKLEEALALKEQALAKEEQSQRELTYLLDEKKVSSAQRQSDIDDAMARARQLAQDQIKSLEADLMQSERQCATYKIAVESAREEARVSLERRDREAERLRTDNESLQNVLNGLSHEMNELKVGRAGDKHNIEKLQEKCSDLRTQVDRRQSELETFRSQCEERERQKDKEITSFKMTSKEAVREWESREANLKREVHDLKAQKETIEAQVGDSERRRIDDTGVLRKKVIELELRVRELEQTVAEEEARHRRMLDDEREQSNKVARTMDFQLKDERKIVETLLATKKELEATVSKSCLDKEALMKTVHVEKTRAEQLFLALRKSKASAVELAEKLASSFRAREEAAGAASRAIAMFNQERDSMVNPTNGEFSSTQGPLEDMDGSMDDFGYLADGVAVTDFTEYD